MRTIKIAMTKLQSKFLKIQSQLQKYNNNCKITIATATSRLQSQLPL